MKALVVYESIFGNTEQVAQAIARGLSQRLDVEIRDVSTAPSPIAELLDLIVAGGPTHAFLTSRPTTPAEATEGTGNHGHAGIGLREWMARLGQGPHSAMVAVFDTRVEQVRHLPGSAAKHASRTVERLGYERIGRESFYVVSGNGPLEPGELDRAESWGRHLAAEMALRAAGQPAGGPRPAVGS